MQVRFCRLVLGNSLGAGHRAHPIHFSQTVLRIVGCTVSSLLQCRQLCSDLASLHQYMHISPWRQTQRLLYMYKTWLLRDQTLLKFCGLKELDTKALSTTLCLPHAIKPSVHLYQDMPAICTCKALRSDAGRSIGRLSVLWKAQSCLDSVRPRKLQLCEGRWQSSD